MACMHIHSKICCYQWLPSFCFSRAPSRDSLTRVCSLSRLAISRKTGKTETAMQLSKNSLKDHRVIMFAAYPDHTACVVLNKSTNRMGSFKGVFEYLFTCNLCFQFTDLIPFLRQQMKNFFLWWPRVDLQQQKKYTFSHSSSSSKWTLPQGIKKVVVFKGWSYNL